MGRYRGLVFRVPARQHFRMGAISCNYLSGLAVVTALLLPEAAAGKAKEPLRLAPSSKWMLEYAEDSCRIGRSFGEGDQKVTVLIDRYEPGDPFRLQFVGKPVRTSGPDGEAEIRFGPVGPMQERAYYAGTSADKTPAIIVRGSIGIFPHPDILEDEEAVETAEEGDDAAMAAAAAAAAEAAKALRITPEQEAAVTFVELGRPVRVPVILETGSLDKPFAAMRQCTDELLEHWGIDVARHATLSRPVIPIGNPGRWVRSEDYPRSMAWQGKRAIVMFRLNVDESGQVSACHIQNSIGDKPFDEAVCAALKRRARFEPALDGEGRPVASYWINTVNFHV